MTVTPGNNTLEEKWKNIKQMLKNKAEEVLGTREKDAWKPWTTEVILELMNEQRKYKNRNNIGSNHNYKHQKCHTMESKESQRKMVK